MMTGKNLARIGAAAFVGIAITVAAIEASHVPEPVAPLNLAEHSDVDPLRRTLIYCSALGERGGENQACLAAWAENRHRFLAPGSRPAARIPDPDNAFDENVIDELEGPR
jgi:conjugative transfer region protein TrbK